MLTESQKEDLRSLHYINKIDETLTIISEIGFPKGKLPNSDDELVFLNLNVFYAGEKITKMSFNLINYAYEDIVDIATNIKSNAYLLKEVDDYLCGDIE